MPKQDLIIHDTFISSNSLLRVASINLMHNSIHLEERMEMLIEELLDLSPDVLCLQEVLTNGEYDYLDHIASSLGFTNMHMGEEYKDRISDNRSGVAILTRFPGTVFRDINLNVEGATSPTISAIKATFLFNNNEVNVYTAHLCWGGHNTWVRQEQIEVLAMEAELDTMANPDSVTILCGDLNEEEDAHPIQYLYGKAIGENDKGTFWVDAWKMFGNEDNRITSSMGNKLAIWTATRRVPVITEMVPDRRIDYMLVHGWVYGRTGSPMSFMRWADEPNENGLTTSDHYGVLSDIYLPVKEETPE